MGSGEIVPEVLKMALPVLVRRNRLTRATDFNHKLIALWLHGRGRDTQRAYLSDAQRFLSFVQNKSLNTVTLGDLQEFADSLDGLAASSQRTILGAIKSLLAFGHKQRLLPFNVGSALILPPLADNLAERILSEDAVHAMLGAEPNPRNRAILLLLYVGGLRVSEICSLKWRNTQPRGNAGQITVFGKGGKTRAILLPELVWNVVHALHGSAGPNDPVFNSRKGGHLDESAVWRIVKSAAARGGVDTAVSPHWLRHAHASHALDNGAPIHEVQSTLGHSSVATTSRYLHARPNSSSGAYLRI